MSKFDDDYAPQTNINPVDFPFPCQWIISVLNKAIEKTVDSLEKYDFSDAATAVYHWWQYQLCDVFIELIKPHFTSTSPESPEATSERRSAQDTLWLCLDNGLRLLHPFMPFVTEELWQRLSCGKDCLRKESIVVSEYPSCVEGWSNVGVEDEMKLVEPLLKSLRSLRSQLPPNERYERREAFLRCRKKDDRETIIKHELAITTLATLSSI